MDTQPESPHAGRRADWWLSDRTWTRLDLVVAALTAVLTAVLAWVFRTEIVSTDPWHYVMAALEFPQHSWVPLGFTRYGMILPLWPLVLLWGHAPATFYVPALIAAATLAGSVYLLGTRFWSRTAGLTAVILLLSNWIVFTNLSRYYPDIPSMALVLLALVLALAARDRPVDERLRTDLLVATSGLLLGWSFEARETALFAWPLVITALWVRPRVGRNAVLTAVPVLAWAVTDIAIGAVAYGDPLLKLHTFTRQDLSATTNPADLAVMNQFVGLPRGDYLTMIPRLIVDSGVPGGVWFLVLGALTLLAFAVRDTSVRLCAAALAISYIFFVGVGGFFSPSHPAGRLDVQRYWIQFVPWMTLAVAGATHVAVKALAGRTPGPRIRILRLGASTVLVAASIAAIVPAVQAAPSLAVNGGAAMADVSGALARLNPSRGKDVYTDWQTMRILPIYRTPAFGGRPTWRAPVRSLTGSRPPEPGDYVLLVRSADTPCAFCNQALKPWRDKHPHVPATWKRVFSTEGDGYVLYEVR